MPKPSEYVRPDAAVDALVILAVALAVVVLLVLVLTLTGAPSR